jgi:hypothetical protein
MINSRDLFDILLFTLLLILVQLYSEISNKLKRGIISPA